MKYREESEAVRKRKNKEHKAYAMGMMQIAKAHEAAKKSAAEMTMSELSDHYNAKEHELPNWG